MYFMHGTAIWEAHPSLHALTLVVDDVLALNGPLDARERLLPKVDERQAACAEPEMPEIASWRAAFSRMGLTPSTYRCGAEALLRRYRKQGGLPLFHPLVDYLNVVSMAFAIPIAAFDCEMIAGGITVREADGSESYRAFGGEVEHPLAGEVVFADEANEAHSRRWTFRQSAKSLVTASSDRVLIVVEALHPTAARDLEALGEEVRPTVVAAGARVVVSANVTAAEPRLEF